MAGDPRDLFAGTEGYAFTPEAWEMMGEELGLNRPLAFQYAIWLGKIVRGDWGQTLIGRVDVFSVIVEKIPATARLATVAWFFSTIIGIPLGVLSAVRRSTIWDYGGRVIALFGQATPSFWVGIMAILIFAVYLGWLPSGRSGDWKHFVLPTITLATEPLAGYLRLTRSAMLEILDSQYIVLARAKGVNSKSVVWKHALRNAIIPPLTVSGLLLAGLLTGSVIVESVFAWPGVGRLAVQAVMDNDFQVLTGIVLLFTTVYVVLSFVVDLAYALVDPRIRYT
jgi:ABC-type dipeptide/oligopeptide/nickel transport system permease component